MITSLDCNVLLFHRSLHCMQDTKTTYQDGNSPIGVGRLLILVWTWSNIYAAIVIHVTQKLIEAELCNSCDECSNHSTEYVPYV
jgi:hypothetical protein